MKPALLFAAMAALADFFNLLPLNFWKDFALAISGVVVLCSAGFLLQCLGRAVLACFPARRTPTGYHSYAHSSTYSVLDEDEFNDLYYSQGDLASGALGVKVNGLFDED